MSKKETKNINVTPTEQGKHCLPLYGMFGIMVLFVIGSIAYSTFMVAAGTQGIVPKVMLVPQVVFSVVVAIYKFIQ